MVTLHKPCKTRGAAVFVLNISHIVCVCKCAFNKQTWRMHTRTHRSKTYMFVPSIHTKPQTRGASWPMAHSSIHEEAWVGEIRGEMWVQCMKGE